MDFAFGAVGAGDVLKTARAEISEHEFAAGFDHTQHFFQHRLKIADVVHCVQSCHRAKALIRPGQSGGILKNKLDPVFHPEITRVEPGRLLFLRRNVHRRDVADVSGELDQKASLAGANFEHGIFQRQRLLQTELNPGLKVTAEPAQMGVAFKLLAVMGENFNGVGG
jgi:hypothetical protein